MFRRRAALLAAVILPVLVVAAPPAVANTVDAAVSSSPSTPHARPAVTLVVSAPPRARGTTLGPEAFTLSVAGSPVPVTVAPGAPSFTDGGGRARHVGRCHSRGPRPRAGQRPPSSSATSSPARTSRLLTSVAPFVVVDATTDVASAMAALGSPGHRRAGRARPGTRCRRVGRRHRPRQLLARTVLFTADPAVSPPARPHHATARPSRQSPSTPHRLRALQGHGVAVHPGEPRAWRRSTLSSAGSPTSTSCRSPLPAEAAGPAPGRGERGGDSYRLTVDLPAPPATTAPPTTPPPTTPAPPRRTHDARTHHARSHHDRRADHGRPGHHIGRHHRRARGDHAHAPAAATTAPHVAAPRPLLNGPDQSVAVVALAVGVPAVPASPASPSCDALAHGSGRASGAARQARQSAAARQPVRQPPSGEPALSSPGRAGPSRRRRSDE